MPSQQALRLPAVVMDFVGWTGAILIVLAYFLNVQNMLERGQAYNLLNLLGASGVALGCWYRRTWFACALNVVWAGIALVAMLRT